MGQLPVFQQPRAVSRQEKRKGKVVQAQEFLAPDSRTFAQRGDKISSILMGTVAYSPNALDLPIGTKVDLADINEETGAVRALTGDGWILRRLSEFWLKVYAVRTACNCDACFA